MDFTMGLPIILKLSPKTRKIFFQQVCFKINFANFDLWFFPKQKYGSKGAGINTKSVVIELLRFLIEKLLFLLSDVKMFTPRKKVLHSQENQKRGRKFQ